MTKCSKHGKNWNPECEECEGKCPESQRGFNPAYRARFVFGQEMKACPKCGGYNIGFSTPIKLSGPLPDSAKGMLAAWVKARKGGATPLEGTCRIMCRSCGHLGPAVNVEGRTAEDVGRDKAVCAEVKRLWNSEDNALIIDTQPSP